MSKPLCLGSVDPDSDDDIVPQRFTYGGSVDPGYDGGENNIPQQSIFCTNKDMRTYPLMDDENLFLLLHGSSQKIAHTSLVIYQFLVKYHILVLIKGSNWMPIHQVCQRRILNCYNISLKDFYYHTKLLDQT